MICAWRTYQGLGVYDLADSLARDLAEVLAVDLIVVSANVLAGV